MHDLDNWIIMECQYVFFFEGPMVNSRYKQKHVELHEISKDKGILTSESSEIGNVRNESPSQVPLEEEQPTVLIGRPVRTRKQSV